MQIGMSLSTTSKTQGSQFSAISDLSDDDNFVLVKMNVPRNYMFTAGFPRSQGDFMQQKGALNRDLAVHIRVGPDKNKMAVSDTEAEFATVTVNLISRKPKEDEEQSKEKDDNDKVEEIKANDDNTEKEQDDDETTKDTEELEELEIEEYENESLKTKLLSAHSVVANTLVPVVLPNIFMPCHKCAFKVNICHVRSHREFHGALQTLKFAVDYRPKCLKTLIKRRLLLIKRMLESSGKGLVDRSLQKINTAFEILKAELEGTGNAYRVLETSLDPKINNFQGMELSCTTAVGLCEESNSHWKTMEDAHTYLDHFLQGTTCCFIGIYDGYCGNATAKKCATHLHVLLQEKLQDIFREGTVKLTSSKETVASAFKQAYNDFQKMLVSTTEDEESSRSRWSGCSALTFLLTEDACFLANAGNVGALLIRDNAIVKVLTSKHDLYNKKERERVRRSKGIIVKTEKCALINGALGTTRGLGNIGDMDLYNCIINDPKFRFLKLLESDQIIVLASSGLWKMFSYEETTNLVFGFFRKIKRDVRDEIAFGERIPNLSDEGRLDNEYEEIYERLEDRHVYFNQFLRPKTSKNSRQSTVIFLGINKKEKDKLPKIRIALNIPWWKNNLGKRRMSDTCLSYQGNVSHSIKNEEQMEEKLDEGLEENDDIDITLPSYKNSRRRHSLPHEKGVKILHTVLKTDFQLTQKDKQKLLAKFLARRLVKSAVLAGSLDNLTVFVILLPGFSLVNVHTLTSQFLEKLERPQGLGH